MSIADTLEAKLKAQSTAVADEAIASAGVKLDEAERRSLVNGLETQAIVAAEFSTGTPAEILAECARVSRQLADRKLSFKTAS